MSCAQRARLCCGDPLELHGGFSIPLFRRRQLCSHLGVRIARFRLTRKGSCVCCSLAVGRPGPPVPGSGAHPLHTGSSLVQRRFTGPLCHAGAGQALRMQEVTKQDAPPCGGTLEGLSTLSTNSPVLSSSVAVGLGVIGVKGVLSAVAPPSQTTWGLDGSLRKFSPDPVLGTPDVGPWIITGHLMQCN